jgi:peptide/nickel transport system permease protein
MGAVGRVVLQRLIQALPVLIGVTFYVFVMLEVSPIDARYAGLGLYASDEAREQLAEEFGLNDPIPIRYGRYLRDLAGGDFGVSIYGSRPVLDILQQHVGITLTLAASSVILGTLIAFVLGVTSAYFAGSWWDAVVRAVTFGGLSMPVFWLALLLIQIFALNLTSILGLESPLLPAGGWVPFSEDPVAWLKSLILPTLSIALPVGGFLTRVVRSSVLDELEKDYVRTARGIGLRDRVIVRKNVLRNALVAPLTVLGLQAGYLLGGAVLVERVFNIPGLGWQMMNSATTGDFNIVTGIALIAAVMFILANLAADVAFIIFKPSARESS